MVLDSDGVGIHLLIFQIVGLALLCLGANHDALGVLSVLEFHVGAVVQHHFLCEALALLFVSFRTLCIFGILCVLGVLVIFSVLRILGILGVLAGCSP